MNTATTHEKYLVKMCTCGVQLKGRQKLYCSRKCHNASGNFKHQNYQAQQKRGLDRKLECIRKLGGCCSVCGYKKNIAALVFHHQSTIEKGFELSIREFSNNSMATLERELSKCSLLCHNCHMEIHYPHYTYLL